MDCTNIIGEKIKSLRTNQEISIQELAERAGLTVEQVSRIEENIYNPQIEMFARFKMKSSFHKTKRII